MIYKHKLADHYDDNGEWCCDIQEGTLHDLCWFRPRTFKEKHPFLAKLFFRKK